MAPLRATVVIGHVIEALRRLPPGSVHCVVTSPPYYGLRDYGTASWEGGDPSCLHLTLAGPLTYGDRKRKWQHANNGLELAKALGMGAPGARAVTDADRLRLEHPAGGAVCADCGAVRAEPTVWGGDPACEHEWTVRTRYVQGGAAAVSSHAEAFIGPGPENAERIRRARWRTDGACAKCGAWRGALGLEPVHDCLGWATGDRCGACYVCHVIQVMAEVRRVLRDDGTAWLNIGDSYATGAGAVGERPGGGEQGDRWRGYRGARPESPIAKAGAMRAGATNTVDPKASAAVRAMGPMTQPNRMPLPGLKPKDLILMPQRLALALQADGWWVRSDVVWHKPNPMPESVTDRPTRGHEYVLLLAKSERYYYDADAIREPFAEGTYRRVLQAGFDGQAGGPKDYGRTGVNPARSGRRALENLAPRVREAASGKAGLTPRGDGERWNLNAGRGFPPARDKTAETPHLGGRRQAPEPGEPNAFHPLGRNKRTVWTIATEPYPEAHFATFPGLLVLPCVLAGTSGRGCCPDCGAPWERVSLAAGGTIGADWNRHARGRDEDLALGATIRREAADGTYRRWTAGWRPGCVCGAPPELGLRPDDLEPILSPEGAEEDGARGDDPSLFEGRAGFGRPRDPEGEGIRTVTRYEQRMVAAQLAASPHRQAMEAEAGPEAFAHYLRTDRAGARPVPPILLEAWTGRGWLEPVEVPAWDAPEPAPCTVLDPFAGSGTTLLVAANNGRRPIGVELKPEYLGLIRQRLEPLAADLFTPVELEVVAAGAPGGDVPERRAGGRAWKAAGRERPGEAGGA